LSFEDEDMRMNGRAKPQVANVPKGNGCVRELCRTIVVRSEGTEVLLADRSGWVSLPLVEIPKHDRIAESVTAELKRIFALSTVCLFTPDLPQERAGGESPLYQVMDVNGPDTTAPQGTKWVPVSCLQEYSFFQKQDSTALTYALRQLRGFQNGLIYGPFARTGWIRELLTWVEEEIRSLALRPTGKFWQFNAAPTFALLRLETSGPALWFKAVGHPNRHELRTSLALASYFPGRVPSVIATRPCWNGWLMREVEGYALCDCQESRVWESTASSLAQLQVESVSRVGALLDCGCKDIRTPSLLAQIEPFLDVMEDLMGQQASMTPPSLTRAELHSLATDLKNACIALGQSGFPDTLCHLDFNPGNILVSQDGCVFLDWAEACVGHPFLTLEYLRSHWRRTLTGNAHRERDLISAYLETWVDGVGSKAVHESLTLSPLVAVLAYALGGNTWREAERLRLPGVSGYLRSLTRRMANEAKLLRQCRALQPG
jgi:hypothetical protein